MSGTHNTKQHRYSQQKFVVVHELGWLQYWQCGKHAAGM